MNSMGRRSFLAAATALGLGAGVSTHAIASAVSDDQTPKKAPDQNADSTADIYQRDRDLPFIGAEETFSTPELLKLNSINADHIAFLTEIGLADLPMCPVNV